MNSDFRFLADLETALSGIHNSERLIKHCKEGRLTARERIMACLDIGSPFVEIGQFVGGGSDETPLGAGIIVGIGLIKGRFCLLCANDGLVKGGTYYPLTVKKHLRGQEIALENRLPCIYLVDSGGAYLPLQDQVFPDKEHFGRIFFNQARMSALGIPQIAAVFGSCTAGGAYVPAMSDYVIMVDKFATIFLGGPPLVKAATGEVVTSEELGGATLHSRESGVCDYLAQNDYDAVAQIRSIVAQLPHRSEVKEVNYLNPNESDFTCDSPIRQIINGIVDGGSFNEFKHEYGKTLITGFATLTGMKLAIVANDGILFSESALKGSQFIQLANRENIPLLFLQDITGFMVGRDYEIGGIAKNGAKMVNSVACATVPKITIIIRNSYGAGNYGMCGRAYSPRFLFSWPSAKISVMGDNQLAEVLATVKARKGSSLSVEERQDIINQIDKVSSAKYSTSQLWDDGIVKPQDTRQLLSLLLPIATTKHPNPPETKYGIFRM
jgi:3-methylcrotonyl-CoA carboxylase beta subunit